MEQARDTWSFIETAQHQITENVESADMLANRMILSITRTASAMVYDLESTIHRPGGGTWSSFRILFALWLGGPASPHDVSKVSGMSRATISNVGKTLMEKGLVRKDEDPDDGRGVVLSLTESGQAQIADAFARHHEREKEWAGLLTPVEQQILVLLLDKVMRARASIGANERS